MNKISNNKFKFSAIICVYCKDNAKDFDLALKSITVDQICKPDEVVIAADGPLNEKLDGVIQKYESLFNNIKVIRLEKNMGAGYAANKAIENCSYDYVARMDADDISSPKRFKIQTDYMASHKVDLVGGNISEFIGKPSNIIDYRNVPEQDKEIKKYMRKRCPINQMTIMFRKAAVERAGGYMEWFYNEDYYLWIRMYLSGAVFANVQEVLVNVRVGSEMYQRRGGWKYFKSERKLQRYMLSKKVINLPVYIYNVTIRFIVQVLLGNRLRGFVFRVFARNSK